jgi:D-arabinan exo alpha-(1,3)/(1,5)-arabinofuranosidase (non-reducing end)
MLTRLGTAAGSTLALVVLGDSCGSSKTATPPPEPPADAGPFVIETDNPTIPVGLDAYRMWNRWPYLRLATRAYMRSTYDRAGGNEAADASHFLRLTSDRAVVLDVVGSGVLDFVRTNRWHGSPWHYLVDGNDRLVQETDTAAPDVGAPNSTFLPASPFPPPLALTWSTTQGADLMSVPIPFTRSLELGYERSNYGTGYFIYDLFPSGAHNLSQPLATWTPAPPAQDVLDLINQAGQDIAPTSPDVQTLSNMLPLPASGAVRVFDATGPSMLRALKFTVPIADAPALGAATLRATWDGRAAPSIDAPVALLFGTGSLYNRESREYLVKAFPVSVHFEAATVTFAMYFPMPFFRSAHVELVGGGTAVASVAWQARLLPYTDPSNWVGYLHATYTDQGVPTPGQDLVLLDTTQVEGGGDWCGSFVGTSFTFSDQAVLCTLEGDPRFFFDDSQTPQVQGTGTEEWGGGGDYWEGGQTVTLPFFGHPVGAPGAPNCAPGTSNDTEDAIESAYRFLLADLMPFGKNARIQLEHGGMDESVEHYRTVAYWYGLPGACLVQTDALHVSDEADEKAHAYASPNASGVDTLTTRYEWGVDHVFTANDVMTNQEAYPATTDTGRHTTGTSEFSLAIQPKNFGVLLRRKLDYGFPDQRAEVYVAADDAPDGGTFAHAGTWYVAGSNQCAYSDPPHELDPFAPLVEVSNRRWRDDEFLVPRALTEGHGRIRVRIVFTPANTILTPSATPLPEAWSEFRYTAYVWTLPLPP